MKITSILINICGHLLLAALAVLLMAVLSSCQNGAGGQHGSETGDSLETQNNSATGLQHPTPLDCLRVDSVKNW